MCCLFLIWLVLEYRLLTVGNAATIPASNLLSIINPHLNRSSTGGFLRVLSGPADSNLASSNSSLGTDQPWPPAPFEFESKSWPGWSLYVHSYEPQRLTFLQMDALLTTSVDIIPILIAKDPSQPAPARTIFQRPRQRTPLDLSQQDVEVAFYNSAEEPGLTFGPREMIYTLQIIVEILISHDEQELSRKVAHYVEFVPVHSGRSYKRVRVQHRTDRRPPQPPAIA